VVEAVPVRDPAYAKRVGFGIVCSGHEQAVLDLCDVVRPWGEVAIVGVPWVPRTSMLAQKLLHSVFYNFVDLKSGWE
jgi:threonine dehydrogenase-like Zn-dependent dehydrogenase